MRNVIALLAALAACAPSREAGDPADRTLNPLYDRKVEGNAVTTEIRPIFWHQKDDRQTRWNLFWEFIRFRKTKTHSYLRIAPAMAYLSRTSPESQRRWIFQFVPFFFVGSGTFAVFPFAGVSDTLLGNDEIVLVTPFYFRVRRFSTKSIYVSHYLLFGLVAFGSDGQKGGRYRFRIAPFYGRTRDRKTLERGFVMWPFWTWRRTARSWSWFVFPFVGRAETYAKDGSLTTRETTFAFPFGNRYRNYLTGLDDVAVWPFWRHAGGSDDRYIRRIWPFHEFRRVERTTTQYVLWPIWRRKWVDNGKEFGRYQWCPPFYSSVRRYRPKEGTLVKKNRIWPLTRWETYADGATDVLIPAWLPVDSRSTREALSPLRTFTSLYYRRTDADGTRETTSLLGILQTRRTAESRKWRVLGGLVGWDRRPEGRKLTLLWFVRIPVG